MLQRKKIKSVTKSYANNLTKRVKQLTQTTLIKNQQVGIQEAKITMSANLLLLVWREANKQIAV